MNARDFGILREKNFTTYLKLNTTNSDSIPTPNSTSGRSKRVETE